MINRAATSDPDLKLSTQRLLLRPLRPADVGDRYVAWMNDATVSRYLESRFREHSRDDIVGFVAAKLASEREILFGIFLREESRHIGNIKVGPVHPRHGVADVSLLIGDRSCWGKGFATEAIDAVTAFGFRTLALQKMEAGAYADNLASIKAFLACGYREEGLLRDHATLDGTPCDVMRLGYCARDFEPDVSD